jgi:hypothetical protein
MRFNQHDAVRSAWAEARRGGYAPLPGWGGRIRNTAFQMIVIEPDRPVEGLRRVSGGP